MQRAHVGPQAALLPEGDVEELRDGDVPPGLDGGDRRPGELPRAVDVGGGERVGGRGGVAAGEQVGEGAEQEVAVSALRGFLCVFCCFILEDEYQRKSRGREKKG